ncbi:MAG: 50S ribosomal protein L23 [candidate division WOR-3 bacterium]|jgi:large subunit ribosomal protein L23
MDSRDILIRPIITERGSNSMSIGRYTFEVFIGANKHQIKKAVEDLFKVHVMDVNTMIVKGKVRGIGRSKGKRKNWKKAVVSLREGDSIPLFEGA